MPFSPQAYKQGMYGSRYVWVLPGPSFLPGWVSRLDYQTLDCTYQEMIEASDWFIMLDYDRFDSRDIITVSGSVSMVADLCHFVFSSFCHEITPRKITK